MIKLNNNNDNKNKKNKNYNDDDSDNNSNIDQKNFMTQNLFESKICMDSRESKREVRCHFAVCAISGPLSLNKRGPSQPGCISVFIPVPCFHSKIFENT